MSIELITLFVVGTVLSLSIGSSRLVLAQTNDGASGSQPSPQSTPPEEVGLRGLGLRYEPATVPPTITEEQAIAKAKTFPVRGARLDQAPHVEARYVLFGNDQYSWRDAQGQRHPYFQRMPAWIITFTGLNMPNTEPRRGRTAKVTYSHEANVVVNAETGELMEAFISR